MVMTAVERSSDGLGCLLGSKSPSRRQSMKASSPSTVLLRRRVSVFVVR